MLKNIFEEFKKYKLKNSSVENKINNEDNSKKIKIIENKILKLKDLYLEDLIDKEEYKKDYTKYINELNNLRTVKTIKIKKDYSQIENILNSNFISIYNKLNIDNKKRFWLSILDKIYISDGKIKEIIFK